MGQVVSAKGGADFKILEPGTYAAVCTQIVGIGPQEQEWAGKVIERDRIMLRFEVPSERVEWETKDGEKGEGPMVIWSRYTASLSEKAKLRKHLEAWRGRAFTTQELDAFDMDNILGKPCMIAVVHNTATNGRTYANIDSISKLVKGMPAPAAEGELLSFNFYDHTQAEFEALPEWQQELVTEGLKIWKGQQNRAEPEPASAPPVTGENDYTDDDIPF